MHTESLKDAVVRETLVVDVGEAEFFRCCNGGNAAGDPFSFVDPRIGRGPRVSLGNVDDSSVARVSQ
jgi:hypothetical protein